MIEMPRRSVTRFFIPLIDVLTLLFCIYLLLPIVEKKEGSNSTPVVTASERTEKALTARERRELEAFRRRSGRNLQERLSVRVLDIDADTGKLFHYEPGAVEIRSEAEARALIDRQKREAGAREIYYLFLYPRKLTGFPEERQIRQYKRWFDGVAHGFDNPIANP